MEPRPICRWCHLWPLGLRRWVFHHKHTETNMMVTHLYHLIMCVCLCVSSQQWTPALLWSTALGQPVLPPPTRPIPGHLAQTHTQTPGKQHLSHAPLSVPHGTAHLTEVPVNQDACTIGALSVFIFLRGFFCSPGGDKTDPFNAKEEENPGQEIPEASPPQPASPTGTAVHWGFNWMFEKEEK